MNISEQKPIICHMMLINCEGSAPKFIETSKGFVAVPRIVFRVDSNRDADYVLNNGVYGKGTFHILPMGAIKDFNLRHQGGSEKYRRIPKRVLTVWGVKPEELVSVKGSLMGDRWKSSLLQEVDCEDGGIITGEIMPSEKIVGAIILEPDIVRALRRLEKTVPIYAKWGLELLLKKDQRKVSESKKHLLKAIDKEVLLAGLPDDIVDTIVQGNIQNARIDRRIGRIKKYRLVE